jgi:pyruvate/2-oxoglutarate dehydrogenase complex dihydrolipoamide acyltransferase (E2) component
MIKPVIIGKGEQGYTLRGRQVELYTRNRIVQRVLAQAEARVTSEDMLLTADTIDLRVDGNKAQAAYIWGKSRARAVSPDRDLIADSLAVRMPDQQLREVRAYRDAMATTFPDTATVRTGEKDWLKGDTIFAFFDSTATRRPAPQPAPVAASATGAATAPTPAAPTDTATTKPRLREMQSIGHASARYQVSSEGSSPERPAINYSRGDRITVVLDSTGVSRVQIDEHAVGLYLEPSYMTADSSDRPSEAPTPAPAPLPTPVPARAPAATSPAPARPATPVRKPAAKPAAVTPRTTPSRP